MKLYSWSTAPNPRRTLIFLAEKQIKIEVVEAGDPDRPAQLSRAYCERFSHRRVPLLELDDGNWIAEAAAICRYLEMLHPEPALMGRTTLETAHVDMWDRFAETEGLLAVSEYFRNTHKAFVGRGMAGYTCEIAQIPELAERGRLRFELFNRKLDEQLSDREFVTGDAVTLADITAFSALEFGMARRLPLPEDCSHVKRWYEAFSARPSVGLPAARPRN